MGVGNLHQRPPLPILGDILPWSTPVLLGSLPQVLRAVTVRESKFDEFYCLLGIWPHRSLLTQSVEISASFFSSYSPHFHRKCVKKCILIIFVHQNGRKRIQQYNTIQYKFIYMAAISWIKKQTRKRKNTVITKMTLSTSNAEHY